MLNWFEELISGIAEMDRQHRLIISSINEIYAACDKNESKEKLLDLINNFDGYINKHFETEEKYAELYNFPKLAELKSEHEFFKNLYLHLRYHSHYYDVSSGTYTYVYTYVIHLTKTLEEWLIVHLNTIDKELIDYLKSKIIKDI